MELPGGDGDWLAPSPPPSGPAVPDRHDEHGVDTFTWPKTDTSTWPSVGTFSWPRTPRAHFAKVDTTSFNALIVMNDVAADGATFCDHHTCVTRAEAKSQMRLLARVHGQTHGSAPLRTAALAFPRWPKFFDSTMKFGLREGAEEGFAAAGEAIPVALARRATEIWSATLASVQKHDRGLESVIHCDVYLKNWYRTETGSMGLFDWNCCSRGLGIRDVAYATVTALQPSDRRAWERDLIALYLQELQSHGGPRTSFEEAWLGYRQQMITALTWWTVTPTPPPGRPDMQPRDTTLEFIARIATAMDDLDTLDAFAR
ncbi:phosphotransferase [Mycolicibacterium neoaurum]|uniref:phosphotransferase n=1 Tax=Mycolicibacterium neoaurum TaxID=1795 RepID=UPI0026735DE1|nr:phosphotransferase [Mycolicibacterium neoaurum]MDO3402702.1 phosphotransferase [Mycolicibacterium neoaurum]